MDSFQLNQIKLTGMGSKNRLRLSPKRKVQAQIKIETDSYSDRRTGLGSDRHTGLGSPSDAEKGLY